MAQHNRPLKLMLTGTDAAEVPMLNAAQKSSLPVGFLEFLDDNGRVTDLSELDLITIKDNSHHLVIKKSVEFYIKGSLMHGEIRVERRDSNMAENYVHDLHAQDITFVATVETHQLFLEQVRLYLFCISLGMKDFQKYLCDNICTRYPVYEAEIVALLTELRKSPDTLQNTDPALLNHICQRKLLFPDMAMEIEPILVVLRLVTDSRARLLAMIPHVQEPVLDRLWAACYIDPAAEAAALFDYFVKKHNLNNAQVQPAHQTQQLHQAQPSIATQPRNTPAQNLQLSQRFTGGIPLMPFERRQSIQQAGTPRATSDDNMNVAHNVARTPLYGNLARRTPQQPATQGRKRAHDPALLTNWTREQAAHDPALLTDWTGEQAADLGARRPFTEAMYKPNDLIKPAAEGEYWSVTPEKWDSLSDARKETYHRAGLMAETTAGQAAKESCEECKKHSIVCMVFVDAKHGTSCARCIINRPKNGCSHTAATKRARAA